MLKILSENFRLILVGFISMLMILAGAIVLSLYFGGDMPRTLVVSEISGEVSITRDGKKMIASKKEKLKSGDILTTEENGTVKISMDGDKYVWVEPDTSVYIYYTDSASRGDISVNLTKGAVTCQLNNKLKSGATFTLKTPNSSIAVKGTVFRTAFNLEKEYMGHSNVMITEVQNFSGTVELQLYNAQKEPEQLPMVLIERTAAQLITSEDECRYGYLNYSFDLLKMNSYVVGSLIRAGSETKLAFTPEELNNAYKIVRNAETAETTSETAPPVTEEEPLTTTSTETTSVTTETSETSASTTTEPEETSPGTLRTTLKTYVYTTNSGIKWWDITGNTNTGTEGYEDWFTDDETLFGEETTETANN